MRAALATLVLFVAGLGLIATASCDVNKFCVNCQTGATGDGGPGPGDGGIDGGGSVIDAGPTGDGCAPAGMEQCNGEDDDCDGMVDEAPVIMVGDQCGTDVGPCEFGTFECTDGELVCGGGAVLPQAESCNDVDDDCDGTVDDGDPGGGIVCGSDIGECQRGLTACVDGNVECVGEVVAIDELCDTKDNDCDAMIDEGNPEGGAACGGMSGACMPGEMQCIGGTLQCVGDTGPQLERCDGADNDCDDDIDEDFDLNIDPRNCGECGLVCALDNAQPACVAGDCAVAFCLTGFHDLNGDPDDGCEYECDFSGAEVCNGEDDDCDGDVDEDVIIPDICNTVNECAGTVAECMGAAGFVCNYGPTVSTDAFGDIIPESNCDGLDNDCDGVPDDAFPTLGDACSRGIGACQTTGNIACNATQDGVVCDAADPPAGDPEVCDGLDNDCDMLVDEDAPDDFVQIGGGLFVYQYEASRPDATASSAGVMSHRPCSAPNRLPWTNITQPQAEAQCALIGARLCTEAEWQQICSVNNTCTWAYDASCNSFQPSTCNGNDFDFDPGTAGDQDGLLPTGSLAACFADHSGPRQVFDMSGNVKEWTQERSPGVNPLRGGSFNNTAIGISCDLDFTVADDTFQFQNVGFRCCRSTAP